MDCHNACIRRSICPILKACPSSAHVRTTQNLILNFQTNIITCT